MKRMKLLFILLLSITGSLYAQNQTWQVLNADTNIPVAGAHILAPDSAVVAVSDPSGSFTLKQEVDHIRIKALGYQTLLVPLPHSSNTILLSPMVMYSEQEIIVSGDQPEHDIHSYRHDRQSMIGEYMSQVEGMSTVRRGSYAWEPVIRGLSDQRINLTIDNMQVFKACADKMDPITSYVETNNLKSMKIDRAGSSVAQNGNGNASMNLVSEQAQTGITTGDLQTSYRVRDQFTDIKGSLNFSTPDNKNAFRISGTYKEAGNTIAGGGQEIQNSGFNKSNINLSYLRKLKGQRSLTFNVISDRAWDVGYPSLLMDATSAKAEILSLTLKDQSGERKLLEELRIYGNGIRHSMDDYSRDVSSRSVMRDMYMPMYGTTYTAGIRAEGSLPTGDSYLSWNLQAFQSRAFGDMEMISTLENIPDMLIYNLDNVHTRVIALGLQKQFFLSDKLMIDLQQSSSFKQLFSEDDSFFRGLYGRDPGIQNRINLSGSAGMLWFMSPKLSLEHKWIYSERSGNHMEMFGHYIYNYTDGFFYDGNPWLNKERSLHSEFNLTFSGRDISLKWNLFGKYLRDFIDGEIMQDYNSTVYQFKQYANTGDAMILGTELRMIAEPSAGWSFENRMSWQSGYHLDRQDPLPMIPPLSGTFSLSRMTGKDLLRLDSEWALRQDRISEYALIEDPTPAYMIFNFRYSHAWDFADLESILEIRNIMDTQYHTHNTLGNIAQPGRNLLFTLRYTFGK